MERRKRPRFPVQFTLNFLGHLTAGVGSTNNLSTEGCMAESESIVHQGSPLELRLHLPDDDSPVEVNLAVVQWSKGQKFGLEFVRLQPEEEARLRCFVSALETGPSGMERRGYPRFPVQFPISFSGEDIAEEGTVMDLSKRGWKATVVTGSQSVRPGTYLKLRVYLPDQAPPMDVDLAAVRWAKGREFGLEFLIMGSEEEERLHRFVSTLETGPSRQINHASNMT